MRIPSLATFGAVFQAEVVFNAKRIVPYALVVLFAANAVLWWGWGPARALGWATNSEYYIVRNLTGFSIILGLPIFNAVIMGDPVIRDFRFGIDPLIFSKPVTRAQYILGKFFGNFFVLVCCQFVFPLTLFVLQAFHRPGMVVLPVRVVPYFKHFFFLLVVSHMVLAAFYFAAGTLTRNSKIVYGLAVCFYPVYIAYQLILLGPLPPSLRTLLDPFAMGLGPKGGGFLNTAEYLNQLVVAYPPILFANRLLMITVTAICLVIVYRRFATTERHKGVAKFAALNLSTAADRVYYQAPAWEEPRAAEKVPLPKINRVNEGFTANLQKLIAATGIQFRLLYAERSLVVLVPLVVFLSVFELAFYRVVSEVSYSATYASSTAGKLLFFLIGITVFYVGETMHRDREMRTEPVIWPSPSPNYVLLCSKFFASLLLALSLVAAVGLLALAVQLVRGHYPIAIQPYLIVYSVILLPSLVFLSGTSVAMNVLLRDKYLVYAVSIGVVAGLFYLYSMGYHHWLYNPLLYGLWTYVDLVGSSSSILIYRLYCLVIALVLLALAHLLFRRRQA